MKRRTAFFIVLAAIIVILIIISILMFLPKRIVNKSNNIVGLVVKYHDTEIPANQNDIIEILSKYNAVTSLNSYSPYENNKIDFEIYYVDNNKPVHILLGEFNIWYESASWFAHDILDAGQLKKELMDALNLTGESIENAGYEDVEVEEVSVIIKSTEELKAAIKDSRVSGNDNNVYIRNKLRDIEYFYEPAVIFHGYELLQIEVNEYYIFYYYMPKSLVQDAESVMFDYEKGIVVTVARLEGAYEDPLQPIIKQTGIKPNKDNVIFDKDHNSLKWAVDQTWADIQFPKSFTQYEEMLGYCKVAKVMIEN